MGRKHLEQRTETRRNRGKMRKILGRVVLVGGLGLAGLVGLVNGCASSIKNEEINPRRIACLKCGKHYYFDIEIKDSKRIKKAYIEDKGGNLVHDFNEMLKDCVLQRSYDSMGLDPNKDYSLWIEDYLGNKLKMKINSEPINKEYFD